jgi:ABC-2 type transport system permease protein/lipopolysaccharide transport system permease protein
LSELHRQKRAKHTAQRWITSGAEASGGKVADVTQHLEAEANAPQVQALLRDRAKEAFLDLRGGLLNWPLWLTVGWLDIKQRYRRSLIGPFWITLSVAIFVAGLGVVYSALFHMPTQEYLPYLAIGMIVWMLIANLIGEGCNTFIAAEGAIKQVPIPISVHIFRMVWRNVIIFFHNIVIYIIMILPFNIDVNIRSIMAIFGLVSIALNGIGFGIILGLLSARFRDIPPIITNLVQLVFFTTPILWRAETLPAERAWVVDVNPFSYLVESVRQPLLGHEYSIGSWSITCAFTAVNLSVALIMYVRFRARIAYWL